jgi:anthranilate phosphoribosyltransferase
MLSLMRGIMSGEVQPVMIAALTVGLRVKKERSARSRRPRR